MADSKLMLDYIYEHETNNADKVWFTQPLGGDAVVDYTWKQAMDRARRMATHLKSIGISDGDKVGIVSKNCAHFIIAEVAIWMAGGTTVAIYPTINTEIGAYIIEHSDMKALFVGKLDTWERDIKPAIPEGFPCIAFPLAPKTDFPTFDDIVAKTEPIEGKPSRKGDDLALFIYTSGSTGKPKGVMHSFANITAATEGIVQGLDFVPEDRVLSYLPLAHVFERAYISSTSMVAATHVYFAESLDTFVADLKRAHPTLFISVPRLWLKFQMGVFKKFPPGRLNFLLKIPIINGIIKRKVLEGLGLDAVRLAGSGSAPIPADLIAWYRSLGLNLLEGYAMSEDYAFSHLSRPGFSEPGYVGVPYDGVNVKISDVGEILIDSPGKMIGYYKLEDATKESFDEDGFFKTGDKGERKPNGLLKITGRVKEIFKTSKGKYVSPAPIENIINNDMNVELSVVGGLGQPQPYAKVMIAEDLRPQLSDPAVRAKLTSDLSALLTEVNSKVEHHERLQCLVVVPDEWSTENGMLTPTLKIKRNAIDDKYKDNEQGWYDAGEKIVWA